MELRKRITWMALTLVGCGLTLPAWAQADEARAKKIVSGVCFVCHGAEGESSSEVFPRLAGQHAEYIAKQLENFKSGKRKSTAMADMVAKLTADEMVALGHYFEKQTAASEPAKDQALAAVLLALRSGGGIAHGAEVRAFGRRGTFEAAAEEAHGQFGFGFWGSHADVVGGDRGARCPIPDRLAVGLDEVGVAAGGVIQRRESSRFV